MRGAWRVLVMGPEEPSRKFRRLVIGLVEMQEDRRPPG